MLIVDDRPWFSSEASAVLWIVTPLTSSAGNWSNCTARLPPVDACSRPFSVPPLKSGDMPRTEMSCALPVTERRSQTRLRHGERGIWQRHYWEHLIRDEQDYRRHMDYVHINPLKHGHVTRVADWPYSTFHRYVASGVYRQDWCGSVDGASKGLE